MSISRLLFIVDGDHAVRDALRLLMIHAGWDVQTFAGSAECVQAALYQIPDCILSDLSPPAMNAVAIRQTLWSQGLTMPMVALTDAVDPGLAFTAKAAGIGEVLDKPCDADRLEAALQRAGIPLIKGPPPRSRIT